MYKRQVAANAATEYYRGPETTKHGITEAPTVSSEIARAQGRVANPDNEYEVAEAINEERDRKHEAQLKDFNEGLRDKEPTRKSRIKPSTVANALRAKAELQPITSDQRKSFVDKGIAGPTERLQIKEAIDEISEGKRPSISCLLYTSPSPRD